MIDFPKFDAHFTNNAKVQKNSYVPSQEEIKAEKVTFSWCPLDVALREASSVTKKIITEMIPLLVGNKKYTFVDSKIQYFEPTHSPIDSLHWHVDGSISVEDERTQKLGYILLHDMFARMVHKDPPKFLAYQSSNHCATQYLTNPCTLSIPKCIPSFSILDDAVNTIDPTIMTQPAGSIVSFDGWAIHRAVPALDTGWRLWIRVKETDHFTEARHGSVELYSTTFRVNNDSV